MVLHVERVGGPDVAHSCELPTQEVAPHVGVEGQRHTVGEASGNNTCEGEGYGIQKGDNECHLGNGAGVKI